MRDLGNRLRPIMTATDPTLLDARIKVVSWFANTASSTSRTALLSNLGVAYLERYRYSELPADLEKAIELFSRVENSTTDAHPKRPAILVNLGYAYLERYQYNAQTKDLKQATQYFQRVEALTTPANPIRVAMQPNLDYAHREHARITGVRQR